MASEAGRLLLGAEAGRAIRAHGREAYPRECCGALLGRGGVVHEAYGLPNVTTEGARRRFLIDPGDYRAAEARARAAGLELLGFYHSHPDHPAVPSAHDLAHAWPSFHYAIVSVAHDRVDDLRSWVLADDRSRFVETELLTPHS